MNQCNSSISRHITRRSWLRLSCVTVCMAGCNLLLPVCTRRKLFEVTVYPNESPAQFSDHVRRYYSDRSNDLMDQYDMIADVNRAYLITRYDESKVDLWLGKSRQKYKKLILELPYIGGERNEQTRFLLATSAYIPLLQVLCNEGIPTRQNGHMIVATGTYFFQEKIPWFVKWLMSWNHFSNSGKQKKKAAALLSQEKRYPADWVFRYAEGDGSTFDYEIIYSECALHKFWVSQDLREYVPYLCLCDYAIWQIIGIEVVRTKTIGNGDDECDFKYIKKGSQAPPPWPPEAHPEWTGRFES